MQRIKASQSVSFPEARRLADASPPKKCTFDSNASTATVQTADTHPVVIKTKDVSCQTNNFNRSYTSSCCQTDKTSKISTSSQTEPEIISLKKKEKIENKIATFKKDDTDYYSPKAQPRKIKKKKNKKEKIVIPVEPPPIPELFIPSILEEMGFDISVNDVSIPSEDEVT